MLHRLDNKYNLNLLIDTLLTSLAYSFMEPAVFQTMERDFLRNVSAGSRVIYMREENEGAGPYAAWKRKVHRRHCVRGMQRQLPIILFEYENE